MPDVTPVPLGPAAPWRIGVDVGGTFTDLVLADVGGRTWVAKVPSVPADPSRGALDALDRLADDLGMRPAEVLEGCGLFVHGSTVATNTVLEGKGARVGLLTTRGFRDALEIRRGLRDDQWDHRAPYPPVLVPRHLRLGVGGRLDKDGAELEPLDEGDVEAAAATFAEAGVEAVAIALFNAFLDPAHEERAEAALRRAWDGAWVTRSAAVSPTMGEYERTSTAVVNAALLPRIAPYLGALDDALRAGGLGRPLVLVQSNGGVASAAQVASRPVNLLLSGPAAAVGALNLYRGWAGTDDLISMEIGGTSCDVLLMSGGTVATQDELRIGGYHVQVPAIDIHTIGAGGGTIAQVDAGGLLVVGPEGAGADPGPACYGRGGTRATVTDAQLVLGRLRPGRYAGGALELDLVAARAALEAQVAAPLGLTVEEAAAGVVTVLEQHLLHAVEYLSIERGLAPSGFTLVAAGGAGPMHGAAVGRLLGCRRVYVPRQAGAFCAIGMLHAEVRQDVVGFLFGSLDELAPAEVDARFEALEAEAAGGLHGEVLGGEAVRLDREVDLRYTGQLWSIKVPVPPGPFSVAAVRSAFEAEYQRLFGHVQPGGTILASSLRVVARASTGAVAPPRPAPAAEAPAPLEVRPVWHGAHGWCDSAAYAGVALRPGHRLAGPLVVEEATTTVVVGPLDVLEVDASGNFVVELGDSAREGGGARGA